MLAAIDSDFQLVRLQCCDQGGEELAVGGEIAGPPTIIRWIILDVYEYRVIEFGRYPIH